ncbi:hypothetical protein K493DRAFT_352474 [Basidiobolus meristosporus CBS 931.73]|uniref:Uncharacterized protein n=1 Tax=Basidiobolus meristosporus CBS 931.73 TaxID=1314790 RepID=A0A1Y1Y944_9FUNG|nr:hypothetical protein K493DRAFT_352474 [Basidiobolus meristosporus CBS 931.73]|eukprot:ORX94508.1 hypothetical protein K493DRAFT_352474 [Basidiobolus meristosporus CBS 931.73]
MDYDNPYYPYYWDPYTQTWYVKEGSLPAEHHEPPAKTSPQIEEHQQLPPQTSTSENSGDPLEASTEPESNGGLDFDYEPQLAELALPTTTEPLPELRPYIRKRKNLTKISSEVPISEAILTGNPLPLYGKAQGVPEVESVTKKVRSTEPLTNLGKVQTKLSSLKAAHGSASTSDSRKSDFGSSQERAQRSIEEHKRHLKGAAAYLTRKAEEERNLMRGRRS